MSPFGSLVYTSGGGAASDLRLPGQWAEDGAGLYQNWHRSYDASLGRYIEADPLGIFAGQSVYGYVSADPLNRIDPEGLAAIALPRGHGLGALGRVGGAGAALAGLKKTYEIYRAPFDRIGKAMRDAVVEICEPIFTPIPRPHPPLVLPREVADKDFADKGDPCTDRYDKEWDRCNTVTGNSAAAVRWRQECMARAAERLAWCLRGVPDLQPEWPGSY